MVDKSDVEKSRDFFKLSKLDISSLVKTEWKINND